MEDTWLCTSIFWVSITVFKSMRNPLPLLETMETIDTVFTVWQTALSSSPTPFTLWEQRLCTHVDKQHTLPSYISVILHTHTFSTHRSTQCLTFSLSVSYDFKISEERVVTTLSFSFFICSLYFDSAWIRMSLYEQAASVLFQVQGLSWEQMKVTHIVFRRWWSSLLARINSWVPRLLKMLSFL